MNLEMLQVGLSESIIYSLIGVLIMAICFWSFEKLTQFSVKKEIVEDENIALWVMFAWFFIAVAIIIAAAIK